MCANCGYLWQSFRQALLMAGEAEAGLAAADEALELGNADLPFFFRKPYVPDFRTHHWIWRLAQKQQG